MELYYEQYFIASIIMEKDAIRNCPNGFLLFSCEIFRFDIERERNEWIKVWETRQGRIGAKCFKINEYRADYLVLLFRPMRRNVYFSKYDFKAEAFFSSDENIELPIISRYNNKYLRFLSTLVLKLDDDNHRLSLSCNRRDQFGRGWRVKTALKHE